MKLIVGLGNPGKEYNKTRHNVGFMCLDELASAFNVDFDSNKFQGLYTQFNYKNEKVILLKPQKYMNLSGEVIKPVSLKNNKNYLESFNHFFPDEINIPDNLNDNEIEALKDKNKWFFYEYTKFHH